VKSLQRDLGEVLEASHSDVLSFRNMRLYMTGGTGFVGTWFLSSIVHANAKAAARIRVDVLTRDPNRFVVAAPHVARDGLIRLVRGDVISPPEPEALYDAVVHAATPADAVLNAQAPETMLHTIVEGTRRVMAIARRSGAIPLLFTSSGAVYGRQPPDLEHVSEAFGGGPDPLSCASAYAEGKRIGELECVLGATSGVRATIARLFAFLGPYLPLDRHFAAGNFMRDALSGGPIRIAGDGSSVRSYLYASELTSWLWAVLARGQSGRAYNVGSDAPVDIEKLAKMTAAVVAPDATVSIAKSRTAHAPVERYVPDVTRITRELGVRSLIDLGEALRRTAEWHRAQLAS